MTTRPITRRDDVHVPGMGTLAMRVTTLEHGHVRYTVRGPHVRGSFVVIPEVLHDRSVLPSTVRVQFGDNAEPGEDDLSFYWTHRPDEPVVYNVRLHGWTEHIDPDSPPSGYFLGRYATCLRDNRTHRELSFGVRRRTEAVVRALVRHWAALPHRADLGMAAVRPEAEALATHEAKEAQALEDQITELQAQRKAVRDRVNAVLGVLRRRPRPVRPADPSPVKVPIVDAKGQPLGVLAVREVAVNEVVPGTVVYEATGAHVHGRFTVGRDRFRPLPLPSGVRVTYGHLRSTSPYPSEQKHEPTVHGVRITGVWDHERADGISTSAPARLPASASSGIRAGMSASRATERRASAVLRALALRYLDRPDAAALQLAAAKSEAPRELTRCREQLAQLKAQQREREAQALRHRTREAQYRALGR
ncbi:hypothetical protein ACRWOO_18350 [Streptomyces sp. NEAU-PBA10]|uniref:PE-PGRS family protein n=1 Tax=Streptomyces tremellae TaxID=1124239 RepID=A0ABP7DYM6_9ACTN